MGRALQNSIKTKLLILTFIVAFPAVCIILYSGLQAREEALNNARKDTQKLVERIANEQQNLVVGSSQLITALAQLPDVKNHDAAKVEPILRKLCTLNPMYANLLVADLNGDVWASAMPAQKPLNIADRRYFRNALTSGQLSSGEYVLSRINGKPSFHLAYPVRNDSGVPTGVIGVGFNISNYSQLVQKMGLPEGTSFVLMDHRGIMLARALEWERYVGTPYPAGYFRQMQQAGDNFTTFRTGLKGDRRIITHQKLRLAGEQSPYLYVTAGIPVGAALQGANWALLKNVTLLLSFLGVAFVFAGLFGNRSIIEPIRLLESASRRLAEGEFAVKMSELVVEGELGRLAQSFDHMACQLSLREQALLDSQQRLASFVANAPVILFALDREGRFTFSEGRELAKLGLHPGQCVGLSAFETHLAAELTAQGVERALAGETFTTESRVAGLVFEVCYNPVHNEAWETVGTIGVAIDVTERRRAEDGQQQLVTLVENCRDAIGIASLTGSISYLNDAALRLVGMDNLQQARSRTIFDFLPAELSQLEPEGILAGIVDQQYWTGETSLLHVKTGAAISVEMAAFVIKDQAGAPMCLATVTRDLTMQKSAEAEREKLEAQLLQAQRLESIGRLAGGVAHDFNNLLTPIMVYAELLLARMQEGSKEARMVGSMREAADRARVLTQQLLSFGRKQMLTMEIVDVNGVVTSFHEILRRTIRESVEIRLALCPEVCGVRADRNQLEQIIMNLCINAQDAIDRHGTITIETAPVLLGEGRLDEQSVAQPGQYLMLAVTDTGCGMSEETQKHIFEPFYTTKAVGSGTGLGLATVYGLVKQHGGHLWVYSEIDKGSVFKIFLPAVLGLPAAATSEPAAIPRFEAGARTILLVEDNELVRNLVHDLLLSLGFTLLVSGSPAQALETSVGRDIDLLVSDIVMPGMTGPELYRKLLGTHPALKVLYMSGYTDHVVAHHGVPDEGANFIQKPFSCSDMAQKIEKICNA
jgi:two-component system, cell cycle sensor histidine kinase and response regulator CckA